MANPHKGEVEFTVAKTVYTLHFSINAMVELEEAMGGIGITELAMQMGDPSKFKLKDLRTIFWAGLRDHHEAMSAVDAGRLMSELGMVEAMQLVAKAFTLAFPAVDPDAGPFDAKVKPLKSTGKAH